MSDSELMEGWRFDARSGAECGNLPVPLCPQGKSSGIVDDGCLAGRLIGSSASVIEASAG